jgi:glycosyltransferase involved in cell wall biosynthesis
MEKNKKITLANFFPPCENVHLTKDSGVIPYVLQKHYGYDSTIICYKNGEYPNLDKELPGLKMMFMGRGPFRHLRDFVKNAFGEKGFPYRAADTLCLVADALPLMLRHGGHIDVLELNHIDDQAIAMAWIYRMINRSGLVYIKLDLDPMVMEEFKKRPELYTQKSHFIYRTVPVDMMSIETKRLYEFARSDHPYFKLFKDRIFYIASGIEADKMMPLAREFSAKENIILHVSRMGTQQKATEVILEAFAKVARDFPGWTLELIGTMEKEFDGTYYDFLKKNADITSRVHYLGFINSRETIYDHYSRAKVFMFPSRFESFGLVVTEAGFFGDVIVGSDIPSNVELTDEGKCGYLCSVDDVNCLAKKLRYLLSHEDALRRSSQDMERFIRANYDWRMICGRLDVAIRETMVRKVKGRE